MAEKTCLQCRARIYGRSDKKFCTNYCRSAYHNSRSLTDVNYVRRINYQLLKNRKILERGFLEQRKKQYISYRDLFLKGFSFMHCTHKVERANNHALIYCYEYGYEFVENERIRIVQLSTT